MVKLGSAVKDLITGATGIAVGRCDWLYGCSRVAVESTVPGKDGKPADCQWYDEQRVEVTEEGKHPAAPAKPCNIQLGSEVRDRVTGFAGLAVAKTVWLGGNTLVMIEPTRLHDGKPVDSHSFDVDRVELVQKADPPVSKSSSARSGGPQRDPVR
jgi:hypothetical protein